MFKKPYHDWEIKHGLLNKSVEGFRFWNYMRRDMLVSFNDEGAGVEPPFYKNLEKGDRSELTDKALKVLSSLNPFEYNNLKKSDVLFLSHPRRQNIDGKMVSIYTDFLADRFENSLTYQRNGRFRYRKDSLYTKNVIFGDTVNTRCYVYRHLVRVFDPKRYSRIREEIIAETEGPFKDLSENYGYHPDIGKFADRAAALFFFREYKKPVFKKLLDRICPKVIVEVVGQGFDALLFNEIAYERGIQTIELQHGAATSWYPDNVEIAQYPRWFYSFGEYWSRELKLPIPRENVVSMGFPYHDMTMEDYPEDKRKRDPDSIIFLSSRKYGKALSEVAAELKRLRPSLNVLYKLHPLEVPGYRENYPLLDSSGVEVIADNKNSLYDLFSRCSMQVGVESTAVFEGMGFSLRTYIWDIPKAEPLKNLTKNGYALLFKDAGELASLIDENTGKNPDYDINDFWKQGSIDNIERGIRSLI